MPSALTSSFDGSGGKDVVIASGIKSFSSTLTHDLDIGQTMTVVVDDLIADIYPEGRGGGIIAIDDELIAYSYIDEPYFFQRLIRGFAGTTEADHVSGAAVTVCTNTSFVNPALYAAMVAVQERLEDIVSDFESRIATLETP